MASINKVIIVGNLGKDPEMRSFPNGDQVANVSIATTDRWKDKTSGEMKEATEWHRKWTDKDGVEKSTTEIRADQMQMLGSRQGMGGGGDSDDGGYSAPRSAPAARPAPVAKAAPAKSASGFDDMDDDIPF